MAAEPDHLLWKCLCCEDWVEKFRPRFPFSLSVSLSHTCTHIFMVNMVGTRMRRNPLLIFPLWALLSTPPLPPPLSPILTPHHSPQTLPSEQNSWTGEGFPAGPDLSCKKMTHLLKKLGKREKRQFRERKHKQRCFNMMVASGTQREVEEGKRKIAYNTNPLNDSLETQSMKHNLVFRAWMQKNGFWVCQIVSLLESRSKWIYLYFLFLLSGIFNTL